MLIMLMLKIPIEKPPNSHLPIRSYPKDPTTYAQATSPNNSSQIPNNSINEIALFNFLNEFKSFINPLLSLLTTVLKSLLSQNVK